MVNCTANKAIAVLALLLAVLVSCGAGSELESSKLIHVSLLSNWGFTPFHYEAAEYIGKHNPGKYWEFVEKYNGLVLERGGKVTDEVSYNASVEASSVAIGKDSEFLKLNLVQRIYSPKVEMYRQLSLANRPKDGGKDGWLEMNGQVVELKDVEKPQGDANTVVYEFDHYYLGRDESLPTVVLYADIGSEYFRKANEVLKSKREKVNYVLRYLIEETDQKLNLQGYGFELALKNLEYKVMDDSSIKKDLGAQSKSDIQSGLANEDVSGFNFYKLAQRNPELTQKLSTFRSFLLAHSQSFDQLKVWELKDLGVQSAQKIIESSEPLRSLKYISQHFPSIASSLARVSVNETLRATFVSNQRAVPEKESLVLVNGRVLNAETLNTAMLTDILYEELAPLHTIENLGIPSNLVSQIAELGNKDSSSRYHLLPKKAGALFYVNNLEDQSKWAKTMSSLGKDSLDEHGLQIAKNLMTTVVVLDPTDPKTFEMAFEMLQLYNAGSPTQFAVVFSTSEENENLPSEILSARDIARVFFTIKKQVHGKAALFFFQALQYFKKMMEQYMSQPSPYYTKSMLNSALQAVQQNMGGHYGKMQGALSTTEYDEILTNMNEFIKEFNMPTESLPLVFLNGKTVDTSRGDLNDILNPLLYGEFEVLRGLYKAGDIADEHDNLYERILSSKYFQDSLGLPVLKSFSPEIVLSSPNPPYIKLLENAYDKDQMSLLNSIKFYSVGQDNSQALPITHFIGGDFSRDHTVQQALNMIDYLLDDTYKELSSKMRIAFLNSHESTLGKQLSSAKDLKELKTLLSEKNFKPNSGSDISKEIGYVNDYLKISKDSSLFLISNGRLLFPASDIPFSKETIHTLNSMEFKQTEMIMEMIKDSKPSEVQDKNTLAMLINSVITSLMKNPAIERRSIPSLVKPSFSIEKKNSLIKFSMVLSPFSKITQKIAPMVEAFSNYLDISVDVVLNPPLSVSELPMKNYYHYVLHLDMDFDKSTGAYLSSKTSGTITNLPESRVLTLALDNPGSWLVQPIMAKYDLDNIRLRDLGEEQILTAVFELENLVIEGSCIDHTTHAPPSGMEIELSPVASRSKQNQDTIIMNNLGYYQLKSNPGIWKLSLKEGPSTEIMNILDKNDLQTRVPNHLIIDSLTVPTDSLYVKRQPGKERDSLLDEKKSGSKSSESITSLFNNFWNSNKKTAEEKRKEITNKKNSDPDLIHIFSVASGHLYERFLKIMMLSVTKNTNSPVKFWFLKNYLSPGFKEFIPKMAEELGFQYELVTYKWPWWLRKQTEKQRIIWAYKILFLDVLFPLDVKKIIFVDADQVVRTDMKELWDMNLEGAALGLTPFCDSNKDTEGFRFWKQGYWRDHLRGRPYHISALYVVDLQKYRRISAGDTMRATYDQLSRDPNSLANLDQDLPNYLQHQIRIFSLPQEWLWCETWCDQASKPKAKTIDLCNNPLTKTPKLENAVRIISEWTSLDSEAKDLDAKFEEKNKSKSPSIEADNKGLEDIIIESIDEAQNIL